MPDVTLSEAAAQYLETVKNSTRQTALAELDRFLRWYGADRPVSQLRGHDVALYAESLGSATPETSKRADCMRSFLTFLKKKDMVKASLASHLRLKKSGRSSAKPASSGSAPAAVELTADGVESLNTELESLKEQRIAVREEIRKAMLDKDFRENAPLDAAKDKQGHLEARIREIEAMLKRAVVVDSSSSGGRVRVGTTVRVTNLGNGKEVKYSIVGPTEANAADGRISSVSPVGKALLDRAPGDEVEITIPAGTMRLRVEDIEA